MPKQPLLVPLHKMTGGSKNARFSNERRFEQWVGGVFNPAPFLFVKMPASLSHLPDRYLGNANWLELKVAHWGGDYIEQHGDPKRRIADYRVRPFAGLSPQQKLKFAEMTNKFERIWCAVRLICPQGSYGCVAPFYYTKYKRMDRLFTRQEMEQRPEFWKIDTGAEVRAMFEAEMFPWYEHDPAKMKEWKPSRA